jgi:magnesium transporter
MYRAAAAVRQHLFFQKFSFPPIALFQGCVERRAPFPIAPPVSSPFHEPVLAHARADAPLLRAEMTLEGALSLIRERGVEERIIYFYVVDGENRLVGVLPTRRLLCGSLSTRVEEVMVRRVMAIPQTATLLEACELFVLHKFLAFPIVDEGRRVVGIIDIAAFTEEMLGLPEEPEERKRPDELFEAIGLHLSQLRGANPARAFQYRFPWLLATISSGSIAAVIAGAYEGTLARNVIVACFLALVLALAEAVSIQSMTLTLQALRTSRPTFRWFREAVRREFLTALLLGTGCGVLVFLVAWLWRGSALSAGVIAASVFGSLLIACFSGVAMPSLLHAIKLDPKIAAGPAALAVTDILTLLLYLSLARWFLA